jgi:pimeloyl-ACP methyl ester carboxylesterase
MTAPYTAPGFGPREQTSDRPRDVERLVLDEFRRQFRNTALALDDDFFEQGGDSGLAMQLVHAISRGVGAQIPTDIVFRYPTPRQLAAFLQPGHAGVSAGARASVVALSSAREGRPVFLVPPLYPSPWVFLPLIESLNLTRPIYGLRSPELDWRADILGFDEMVAHYLTEIRHLQPRGPYTLIGYSFGALVALEIANRLALDEEVRDLIFLDMEGPPGMFDRLRRRFRREAWGWNVLAFLTRRELIGARTLGWLGIDSAVTRSILPLTTGPLSREELQRALRLMDPGTPLDGLTLDELSARALTVLKALATSAEWEVVQQFGPMYSDDPVTTVKAYKVVLKNLSLQQTYRVRTVYPGAITIFASEDHRAVLRWQACSARPLNITWVPASSKRGAPIHLSFVDVHNVKLYARELARILDEGSSRTRMIA